MVSLPSQSHRSTSKWYRKSSRDRTDPLIQSLPAEVFKVFYNLRDFANEGEERGVIDCSDEELLAINVAGGDVELLRETLSRLERLRLIALTEGRLAFPSKPL